MNAPRHAYAAYQAASQQVPPLQAVVLLFDGILVRIHRAAVCAEKKDYGEQFNQIIKATDILRGLLASLDMERGGDLAVRLRDTYETNMRALLRTVGRPEACQCLDKISVGLRNLRNAWAELAGMPPANPPPPRQTP